MKRRKVEETIERSLGDIVGNIQEVIEWLEAMKKEGWETVDYNWAELHLVFTRYRLETDEELAKRKKEKQKQKNNAAKTKCPINKIICFTKNSKRNSNHDRRTRT